MEDIINNHLQRMKNLQSVYEERTGQHNILGILINELTEQLRQYNVGRQSELLLEFAKYAMPDNYTPLALNNIVKTFLEERKQ